ncbi:sodium-coupled monocarboxylate transporter 1-like [Thrips palmi]|uniref:Sodium-coupled monocarboxylate transporter 1-like n=1 Tax=Thrips palmi TaxID=161013 RepID=A0A6P9A0Q6_THRPL|nr:sodium-coupled monocarboxylate transporter 1-like [Thrips palmi]
MADGLEQVAADGALRFGALDYSSFVVMMLVSALVGVYYGFFKKQESLEDYFLGGRNMGIFPIAMSLIASNISGVTMLAVPADIYAYGFQIGLVLFLGVPVVILVVYFFLPTFYKLQYESSYEYLEHRFCKKLRTMSSVFYILGSYLIMSVIMYVPCLAMHQVSGLDVQIINPLTCLVCVFYTCLGGIRAVVWTDALQLVSLVVASFVVLGASMSRLGSFSETWSRLADGGRLEMFNMTLDPTIRATFWNVLLGEGFYFLNSLAVSPSSVQRYLALPTLSAAKRAAWMLALGFVVTRGLSCVTGLVMYAVYYDCDPVARKVVPHSDNLVPHFVMDVAGHWPGLPGVFIAGVFSAALSTVSSVLNTLSGVIYKDFIETRLRKKPSEKRASLILKGLTLLLGVGVVLMVFVVEHLGAILEVALSVSGVTTGATFGLFLLGLFVPWAETVGAMSGAVASLSLMTIVCIGGLHAKKSGAIKYPPLPTRTDGCDATGLSGTTTPRPPFPARGPAVVYDEDLFPLFRLSPFYYVVLGVTTTVVVGVLVSAAVRGARTRRGLKGGFDDLPHPDLLSPPVARLVHGRRPRHADGSVEMYQAVATEAEKIKG